MKYEKEINNLAPKTGTWIKKVAYEKQYAYVSFCESYFFSIMFCYSAGGSLSILIHEKICWKPEEKRQHKSQKKPY